MNETGDNFYEFGEFRLDLKEGGLWRGDERVPLAPKVFDTLVLLIENRGKILSKTEMMNALWQDAFVEESNLSQNIYTLRRVLGKDYIENVPRRGYRFAGEVRRLPENNGGGTILLASQTRVLTEEVFEEDFSENPSLAPRKNFLRRPAFIVLTIIAAFLVLIPVAVGFRYFRSQNAPAPVEKVNLQKLTFTGDIDFPVIAPDGNSFAFTRGDSLFIQDINSQNPIRVNVEGAKDFGFLQFSADGGSLYFRSPAKYHFPADVFAVSRFGGAPRRIAENVWSGFSFSPDNKKMAFVRSDGTEYSLVIKNLETGEEKSLASHKLPSRFILNCSPAFSPDGRYIATVVLNRSQSKSTLVLIETETGRAEEVLNKQVEQTAWLPSGDALLIVAKDAGKFLQLWRFDIQTKELKRVTNDLNIYRSLSLSADGKKLLARQFSTFSHVWILNGEKLENARQMTSGNLSRDGSIGLAWMPDGSLIYTSRIFGNVELWRLDAKDGSRRQLTENTGKVNQEPAVTKDGKSIYFTSTLGGGTHIWRMDASGENRSQITFSDKGYEVYPQISPDGAWLYYIRQDESGAEICRKSLVDGAVEVLTEKGKLNPTKHFLSLSPDGRFLAFCNGDEKSDEETESRNFQIVVIDTEKEGAPRFFQTPQPTVRWAEDGKAFDYAENSAKAARLWRQGLEDGAQPKLLIEFPGEQIFYFAWSADGKNLALARGKQQNDAILLENFE